MPTDRPRAPRDGRRRPNTGRRTGSRREAAPRGVRPAPAPSAAAEVRRRRFTGRAAILVVVLAVLAVSYASSLRAYLQQRSHIGDLKEQIAERRASIDDLEGEKARWQDDAYVRQQARKRFGYLMPGETSYVVLDENGNPVDSETELTDPSTVAQKAPSAVYTDVWESVKLAGSPPEQEPPPLSEIDGSKGRSGQ
jgi:cell division protein FtsB